VSSLPLTRQHEDEPVRGQPFTVTNLILVGMLQVSRIGFR
jgi:hypothetical protein